MKGDSLNTLVIDNGTDTIKAGFSGEDAPRSRFPSIVGVPKTRDIMVGHDPSVQYQFQDNFVGNDAKNIQGVLKIIHPLQQGIIQNWECIEKLWHHIFYKELKVVPDDCPCLITDGIFQSQVPLNSKKNKERITDMMFDTFNLPNFYLANAAALALYQTGRTSGLVVDCGYQDTKAVPIYEGYTLHHAIMQLELGGEHISNELLHQLNKDLNVTLIKSNEKDIINNIKENLCYVAQDYNEEEQKYNESQNYDKQYQLPDGSNIVLNVQRFKPTELLFQPKLFGKDMLGLHEIMFYSLSKSDIDFKSVLTQNIVLTGGNSSFQGFLERLNKDIYSPVEKIFAAWIGGSILSSLSTFKDMWINKAEYQEFGNSIVHRKCF